jgi:hypothetical protein
LVAPVDSCVWEFLSAVVPSPSWPQVFNPEAQRVEVAGVLSAKTIGEGTRLARVAMKETRRISPSRATMDRL